MAETVVLDAAYFMKRFDAIEARLAIIERHIRGNTSLDDKGAVHGPECAYTKSNSMEDCDCWHAKVAANARARESKND